MEVSEKKILVAVDGDPSSLRAVRYATQKVLEMQSSGVSVSLLLLNLYSSWDWTGTAERDGRLSIDQAENYATSSGVRQSPRVVLSFLNLPLICLNDLEN